MACHDQTRTSTQGVWSNNSTSTGVFVPFLDLEATPYDLVRPSFQLETGGGSPADVNVQAAYATSNDGVTWGTAVTFGPAATEAAGWTYGVAYVTLPVSARFIRFGMVVKNAAGTTGVRAGQVTLRLELRAED